MSRKLIGLSILVGIFVMLAVPLSAQAQNQAWIPGLASLIVPGFGQFLNGETDKGLLHLGVFIVLDVGTYFVAGLLPMGYYSYSLVGLAHLLWGLYSGYDAYTVAEKQGFSLSLQNNGLTLSYAF